MEAQYEQQLRLETAFSQRPRLVRQSLDGVANIMQELDTEANAIRAQFTAWRARFTIVFDAVCPARATAVLLLTLVGSAAIPQASQSMD